MPPFVLDNPGARVSLPRLDHPAIPAEAWLVQLAELCTPALTVTKEIDVLVVKVECHLEQDQVMLRGNTPAQIAGSRER